MCDATTVLGQQQNTIRGGRLSHLPTPFSAFLLRTREISLDRIEPRNRLACVLRLQYTVKALSPVAVSSCSCIARAVLTVSGDTQILIAWSKTTNWGKIRICGHKHESWGLLLSSFEFLNSFVLLLLRTSSRGYKGSRIPPGTLVTEFDGLGLLFFSRNRQSFISSLACFSTHHQRQREERTKYRVTEGFCTG